MQLCFSPYFSTLHVLRLSGQPSIRNTIIGGVGQFRRIFSPSCFVRIAPVRLLAAIAAFWIARRLLRKIYGFAISLTLS
jgi:hypothetical protein